MKLWLKEKRRVNPEELLQWKNSAVSAFWRSLRCRNRAVTKVLQAQTLNIIKPLTTTVLEKGLRNLYLKVSQYLQKRKNGLKKFENKESYVAIQKDLKYQSILAMMLVWRDECSKILEVKGLVSCPTWTDHHLDNSERFYLRSSGCLSNWCSGTRGGGREGGPTCSSPVHHPLLNKAHPKQTKSTKQNMTQKRKRENNSIASSGSPSSNWRL